MGGRDLEYLKEWFLSFYESLMKTIDFLPRNAHFDIQGFRERPEVANSTA